MLLQGQNAKAVSALLGHTLVQMTLDRYAHVLPAMQDDLAATMARLFQAK